MVMIIVTTMTSTSITNPSYNGTANSISVNQSTNSFDNFGQTRGRSTRAASLALPNNTIIDLLDENPIKQSINKIQPFNLAPPSASTINIRRHSSHHCQIIDKVSEEQKKLESQPVLPPILPSSAQILQPTNGQQSGKSKVKSNNNIVIINPTPPPVPKRNFQKKLFTERSFDSPTSIYMNKNVEFSSSVSGGGSGGSGRGDGGGNSGSVAPIKRHNSHKKTSPKRQKNNQRKARQISNGICPTNGQQSSDEDLLSLESAVFEEEECSNDLPVFVDNSTTAQTFLNHSASNRSSSDSNKSHNTIDTGYMTSNSQDNDRIFFGGNPENYRSRFSSVDTQSSIDSFPENQKSINSPLSAGLTGFKTTNSRGGGQVSYYTTSSTAAAISKQLPLPTVPMRKKTTSVPKIPPPNIGGGGGGNGNGGPVSSGSTRIRGIPPVPPMRSQNSIDSGKILQNNGYQSQQLNKSIGGCQEMYCKPLFNKNSSTTNPGTNTSVAGGGGKFQNQMHHHSKFTQRQDSSISSDSYSMTSSPGYNTKSMEAPLLQHAAKINKSSIGIRHQDSSDSFGMTARYITERSAEMAARATAAVNIRQDSNVSSDSFSQTSSPGYNTKLIEAPLIAHAVKLHSMKQNRKLIEEIDKSITSENNNNNSNNPIIKSASTPASLQTIVRFEDGSNASLQHKVVNNNNNNNHNNNHGHDRKLSNPYITSGRIHFRLCQILVNAFFLLCIAGGLAAYFKAYPTIKFINKPIYLPPVEEAKELIVIDRNPAPGVCLPIIVKFCDAAPYNYTVFPNFIGHFGQLDAEEELDAYDALVDVKCYELVQLFLCSLFAPKCGKLGKSVAPCKALCLETTRRCGFFFDVFGLGLPEYLNCNILADSADPDVCIGHKEVEMAKIRAQKPLCSGFLCDQRRCIPNDWRCDGHVDCLDQADESECYDCNQGEIYCGNKRCMSQSHVCDGVIDCPYGQDERNCVRLSDRYGDVGKGTFEVYKPSDKKWVPACVNQWDPATSPAEVCTLLGYNSVNSSRLKMRYAKAQKDTTALWRSSQKTMKNKTEIIVSYNKCAGRGNYQVVDLTCTNYACGKIRTKKIPPQLRIVGGTISQPGDWPFIAAILGGPEEIFYCAGVLIADQWVLTASHCVGNHTLRNINDWTIQLGITRRHSHSYYGEKVKVRRVIPHPQYNSEIIHDNDIALFQLATRVAFHEHLLPVCLPPVGMKELTPGTKCTVIGWGKKELKKGSAAYEPTINEVQVPVLNRELCNEWLVQLNVTEGMICAGYSEGGKDACQGDSGGPLLCRDTNDRDRWFVGGIVSWGVKCAHPKLPGVYANVPKYIPWITQQMHHFSNNHYDNK